MNRRVLVVKLDAIGDFVLFTAVLPHLKRLFARDHIVLGVNPIVAPLAKGCPYVDEIIPIDQARFAAELPYRVEVTDTVRDRYNIVINAMYTRTWQSDNIVARTRASLKVGFDCLDKDGEENRRASDRVLYTQLIPSSGEWAFEHERYSALIRQLSDDDQTLEFVPDLWIDPTERDWGKRFLQERDVDQDHYAIIAPGAGDPIRYWAAEKYAVIATHLVKSYGMNVLILGSSADKALADPILRHSPDGVLDLSGKTGLREMATLISKCKIFIGPESAAFHMAWATGVPAVCVAGGGHFDRFLPRLKYVRIVNHPMDCYRCYWHCIYDEIKCITSITPAMVSDAVEELLSSTPRTGVH